MGGRRKGSSSSARWDLAPENSFYKIPFWMCHAGPDVSHVQQSSLLLPLPSLSSVAICLIVVGGDTGEEGAAQACYNVASHSQEDRFDGSIIR